jgi:tetratricopeptide (TPR) repeat protein
VIELLLQAERALSMGLVDQADRLYRQAADADPRNSIAVVGLARVALERGDEVLAWQEAKRALTIDPENAAAQRMVERFEEVWRYQGQPIPASVAATAVAAPVAAPVPAPPVLAPVEASEAWARITGEAAAATPSEMPRDTHGWPDLDLRPDTETEPEDSAGRAADDGFPVAEDEAQVAATSEVGGDAAVAAPGEWPPAESPHAPTLPGLDRVRHLFTRKRE